jgi:superfamily II DNA/RNA helicase
VFTVDELRASVADPVLLGDLDAARTALAEHRLGAESDLRPDTERRLSQLVEAVLASAPGWTPGEAVDLILRAGEAAEALALRGSGAYASRTRLRAALLYELAAMPMMAAAVIADSDAPQFLIDFFKRRHAFGSLGDEIRLNGDIDRPAPNALLRLAACEDALSLAEYQHDEPSGLRLHSDALREMAGRFELDLTVTDTAAFEQVVRRRSQRSTHRHAPRGLLDSLGSIGFPPELWDGQAQALDAGLLDHSHDSWGLAAPTGTGKTFLARLLVLDALARAPTGKVLYLVPTNALIHQVSSDLDASLKPVGTTVMAIRPQITALDNDEATEVADASVLVLTPEKADLLLRIGAEFLTEVKLVVVDEAHHIEDGTRGVLLELYMARLRSKLAQSARFVLLSAVAPNIREITDWIGQKPGFILLKQRATRMKVGIYKVEKNGHFNGGVIDYTDGTKLELFERGASRQQQDGLVQLAERLGAAGPILVVAQGKGTTEKLARALCSRMVDSGLRELDADKLQSPVMARLDSRLEREMYAGVELRTLVRFGIAYHHAGLPPRVREALEATISAGLITYVMATTTLADGVNFPFSTVVVQSLAVQSPSFEAGKPMSWRIFTPRKFWNIAGRAGRPGSDHEGQVILYEPSLRLEHVGAIDPYLRPAIVDIPPVVSALAAGINAIRDDVREGRIALAELRDPELSEQLPKSARGVVNLLRVGLAHARAVGIEDETGAYFDSTFAARTMAPADQAFARALVREQEAVIDSYLSGAAAPSIELVAELGLSIDTLTRLQRYVRELEDWQLTATTHVMYGGAINFRQLRYTVAPVLKNMAELEGRRLSGWYSTIVEDWCRGKPFSEITPTNREKRLEDLIGLMYSEIQYILPWGLYATDRFVREETETREIPYDGEVNKLVYLVDAGVPSWPALRLNSLGFERTDAARLSVAYENAPGHATADIVRWLVAQPIEDTVQIIRGSDRRALDYDFDRLLRDVGKAAADPDSAD